MTDGEVRRDSLRPGGFASTPELYADLSVDELVQTWSRQIPDATAFVTAERSMTWREYDRFAEAIATRLRRTGAPRSRVALLLPDTGVIHAALCGAYRANRVAAAIAIRSGLREIAHVMARTGASTLVTVESIRGRSWRELLAELREYDIAPSNVLVLDEDSYRVARHQLADDDTASEAAEPFTTSDITILNSTSGTTGLPKVVTHTERRWVAFAREAMSGGRIGPADVICSVVPAPYGFGLWSAHFLPALLGIPVVLTARFDTADTALLVERERATVLCCVSTQFKMLLRSENAREHDLSSLRVLYTGGEPVPYDDALAFEQRTGASVLQFYGSNESGAVSRTTLDDDVDTRLRTCGRILPSMTVRILDDTGADATGSPRRGQPAVRGPLVSPGYWDDPAANAELFTADGWMLLGDIVEVDDTDRVRVVGRTADFVIRGGKNISIVEIEQLVRAHPSVSDVAVVGVPDPIFGERVCAVVVLTTGADLTTETLASWLRAEGVSAEYLPEYVVPVDRLHLGPGGKTDRAAAREAASGVVNLGR
ncbi:class I adenylate-forming enzyme family protein [Nocardia jiangxiensis]|uniref:class I adenylate-forming enzyme family protein n=1 Tax=Nocardia jiangxiensis TaxID=282685 RepID=UPI0006880C60|nr:class I adenylate-forming enzyme family protein [Nocardia jiangxiensis]